MFLMFRLHRPDVLPVGDLGIVNAVQRLYRLRKRPDAKRLVKMGEAWRPVPIGRVLVSLANTAENLSVSRVASEGSRRRNET